MHSQTKSLAGGQNVISKDESRCCGRISLPLWSHRLVSAFAAVAQSRKPTGSWSHLFSVSCWGD